MKRRYVLKNKKRFAAVIMLFCLITVFAGLIVNAEAASEVEKVHDKVCVEQGDTLWEIASRYNEHSDIRAYIYDIKKLNQLENDNIYTGQTLLLP